MESLAEVISAGVQSEAGRGLMDAVPAPPVAASSGTVPPTINPLARIHQLLVSPESNCRQFGLRKARRVLSEGSLASANTDSAAVSPSQGMVPESGEPRGCVCVTSDQEAQDLAGSLLQCLKLSLVPLPPAEIQKTVDANEAMATRLVSGVLSNVSGGTSVDCVCQALGCLDLLLMEFPSGCSRALRKSFRLLLTLCYVRPNSSQHAFIVNLASRFARAVLTMDDAISMQYSGVDGWMYFISGGDGGASVDIEDPGVNQFLEVYQLSSVHRPVYSPVGDDGCQVDLGADVQVCYYVTDLPFIALSYLYAKYISTATGVDVKSAAASSERTKKIAALDALIVDRNYTLCRHLWYWIMFAYNTNAKRGADIDPMDNFSSPAEVVANKMVCSLLALECLSAGNSRQVKNFLLKFSAVDKLLAIVSVSEFRSTLEVASRPGNKIKTQLQLLLKILSSLCLTNDHLKERVAQTLARIHFQGSGYSGVSISELIAQDKTVSFYCNLLGMMDTSPSIM